VALVVSPAAASPPASEAATVSERAFQGAVLEYGELVGWRCYHTHDSRRSHAGYPDLTMVRGDRLVFAELKAETGRVRPAQAEWLAALERCGAVETYLWRPSSWPEIERVLR
jgi:VRR-NUC domain